MKKNSYAYPWKEIARGWKNVKSPNIPNKEERDIYDKYIKKTKKRNKKSKALVLGATYQIRDLLFKNEVETIICELNMNMIIALTELCQKNISDNEVWIKADWINSPLKDNYFDIILADGAINQLPTDLYKNFLERIKKFLKPGGVFVQRTGVTRKEYFKKDEEILEHFLKQKNPKPDIVFEVLTLFSSALNKKTMGTSVKRIYGIMDKHLTTTRGKKNKKLQNIIKIMETIYPRNDRIWTIPSFEEMVEIYKKHFSKIKIESGKKYDELMPAYPFFIVDK